MFENTVFEKFFPKRTRVDPLCIANDTPEMGAVIESFKALAPPQDKRLWGNFIVCYGTPEQIRVLNDEQEQEPRHLLLTTRVKELRPVEILLQRLLTESETERLVALERIATAVRFAKLKFTEVALQALPETIGNEVNAVLELLENGAYDEMAMHKLDKKTSPVMQEGIKGLLCRVTDNPQFFPDPILE